MLSQIYNEAGSMGGLETEAGEMERGVEKQENTRKEKKKKAREGTHRRKSRANLADRG